MNMLLSLLPLIFAATCTPPKNVNDYVGEIKNSIVTKNADQLECLLGSQLSDSERRIIFLDKFDSKTKYRTPYSIIAGKNIQIFVSGQLGIDFPEFVVYFVDHKVSLNSRSAFLIQDMKWRVDYTGTRIVWDGNRWRGQYSAFLVDTDDKL